MYTKIVFTAFCLALSCGEMIADQDDEDPWTNSYRVKDDELSYRLHVVTWTRMEHFYCFQASAALQYFVWNQPSRLELMWWSVRDRESRKLVMALLLIGSEGEFTRYRVLKRMKEAARRFEPGERNQRIDELRMHRSFSISIASKLLADPARFHLSPERISTIKFNVKEMTLGLQKEMAQRLLHDERMEKETKGKEETRNGDSQEELRSSH